MVLGVGWAPGMVWAGAENLNQTGTRSPELPARGESCSNPDRAMAYLDVSSGFVS